MDGVIDVYANGIKVGHIDSTGLHIDQGLSVGTAELLMSGDIQGDMWGGTLSSYITNNTPTMPDLRPYATTSWVNQNFATSSWVRQYFVQDVRLGAVGQTATSIGRAADCPRGHVMVGSVMDSWGSRGSCLRWMRHCPLQKNINGTWYNVARVS